MEEVQKLIRDIPDFPKPGILFKDITPVLQNAAAFKKVIEAICADLAGKSPQIIAGIESRGFIFGAAVAQKMNLGFVPLRKPGKLPYKTLQAKYDLEYGSDAIEMHIDAVPPGMRVAVVDDLLATGGTAGAACCLLRDSEAEVVSCNFMIELDFLHGRERLKEMGFQKVTSLIHFS